MIPIVQFPLALSIIVLQVSIATGQIGLKNNPDAVNFLDGGGLSNNTITKEHFAGLREDRQVNYKLAVPFMSLSPTTSSFSSDSYWMGSVTTQSYNRGKIGRYYYWDMLEIYKVPIFFWMLLEKENVDSNWFSQGNVLFFEFIQLPQSLSGIKSLR